MPRLEEVARTSLASVDTDAHLDLAVEWINHRIQEAAAYGKFRFLRLTRSVTWPAPVHAGTVSIAQGDVRVTGDLTAVAAWGSSLVGRRFQARNVWYDISQQAAGVLTLETPFTEADVVGGSYRIVQHVMALPDYRRVDMVTLPRLRRRPLEIVTRERLDTLAPSRIYLASGMRYVAAAGEDAEGQLQIEVYPYSQQSETLGLLGYRRPPTLTIDQYLPGALDVGILKDGVLVDIYRYEHAKALREGNTNAAMLWQQQLVAQEARWKDARMLLALQDRELDDSAILAQADNNTQTFNPAIVTAYDEVYARGRRP